MWVRERHRHVHVVDARCEGCAVNRHHKAGVHSVEDDVAVLGLDQLDDRRLVGSVEFETREAVRDRRRFLSALPVVVGHDDLLEVAPARRYMGKGTPDSTGSYHKNTHEKVLSRQSDRRSRRYSSLKCNLRRALFQFRGSPSLLHGPKVPIQARLRVPQLAKTAFTIRKDCTGSRTSCQ